MDIIIKNIIEQLSTRWPELTFIILLIIGGAIAYKFTMQGFLAEYRNTIDLYKNINQEQQNAYRLLSDRYTVIDQKVERLTNEGEVYRKEINDRRIEIINLTEDLKINKREIAALQDDILTLKTSILNQTEILEHWIDASNSSRLLINSNMETTENISRQLNQKIDEIQKHMDTFKDLEGKIKNLEITRKLSKELEELSIALASDAEFISNWSEDFEKMAYSLREGFYNINQRISVLEITTKLSDPRKKASIMTGVLDVIDSQNV